MVKKFNEVAEKYLKPKIYSYIPKLDKILGKKKYACSRIFIKNKNSAIQSKK